MALKGSSPRGPLVVQVGAGRREAHAAAVLGRYDVKDAGDRATCGEESQLGG